MKKVSLSNRLTQVAILAYVAGYVEVVGYLDIVGVYPGIMTGNTVQLGLEIVRGRWNLVVLFSAAVATFFMCCLIASMISRRLRNKNHTLMVIALILLLALVTDFYPTTKIFVEFPLLALAMALQGQSFIKFGDISLQTVVVTNNILKFCTALVGRYSFRSLKTFTNRERPHVAEVLLPGAGWFSYSVGAASGAWVSNFFRFSLLLPAVFLVLLSFPVFKCGNHGIAGRQYGGTADPGINK